MTNQTTSVNRTYKWHEAVASETEQLGSASSSSVLTVGYSYRSDEPSPTGNQMTLRNIYYPYSSTTGDYMSVSSTANDVDALGRPTRMTWYNAGMQTTTAVAAYTYAGAKIGSKTYNPDGTNPFQQVWRSDSANNLDAWGRATRDLVMVGGSATLVDQQYLYDVTGNITWQYDAHMQSQSVNWSKSYNYDTLGRLATAQRGAVSNWPGSPSLTTSEYTWDWSGTSGGLANLDKLGNWRQLSFGVPGSVITDTRSHDAVNKIASRACANRGSPTWDANGNLTNDGDGTHNVFSTTSSLHFVYDYRNRLVEARNDAGLLFVKYTYDGLNRRAEKQTFNISGTAIADTWFLWSDWQCLEECNHLSSDAVLRQHVYGVGYLDDHVALIQSDGTIDYYLQDRLHHVVAMTTANATATTERYRYDPYGGLLITDDVGVPRSSSILGNGFTFTGQWWDSDVGLYYYKNRWYSPDLGRFVTQDPSGYVDGMNLYQYVKSMPTMLGDVMGLKIYIDRDKGITSKDIDNLKANIEKVKNSKFTDAQGKERLTQAANDMRYIDSEKGPAVHIWLVKGQGGAATEADEPQGDTHQRPGKDGKMTNGPGTGSTIYLQTEGGEPDKTTVDHSPDSELAHEGDHAAANGHGQVPVKQDKDGNWVKDNDKEELRATNAGNEYVASKGGGPEKQAPSHDYETATEPVQGQPLATKYNKDGTVYNKDGTVCNPPPKPPASTPPATGSPSGSPPPAPAPKPEPKDPNKTQK